MIFAYPYAWFLVSGIWLTGHCNWQILSVSREKFSAQSQTYEPTVFRHISMSDIQSCVPREHSSMSVKWSDLEDHYWRYLHNSGSTSRLSGFEISNEATDHAWADCVIISSFEATVTVTR